MLDYYQIKSNLNQQKLQYQNKKTIFALSNFNLAMSTSSNLAADYSPQIISKNFKTEPDTSQTLSIEFLHFNLNRYKAESQRMKQQLIKSEQKYTLGLKKFDQTVKEFHSTIKQLQMDLKGKNDLIQQYQAKYQSLLEKQTNKQEKINDLQLNVYKLKKNLQQAQRQLSNTKDVSMQLLKQNQFYQHEYEIYKQKYNQVFLQYDAIRELERRNTSILEDDNYQLRLKVDELNLQIQLFQREKEIQKLLHYENKLFYRENDFQIQDIQAKSMKKSQINYEQNKKQDIEQFYDRKSLNSKSQRKTSAKQKETSAKQKKDESQYIELLKMKNQSLQKKIFLLEKRNKELQKIIAL